MSITEGWWDHETRRYKIGKFQIGGSYG
jgi:hypothetical protein